ncbi:MAG: glycoside hydrolase family 20 zincin-like fold domain-containing protein, partial [Pirellulaceae bacterium]|nr:glycoside hydrolase family 20 zincin-like fold domain-containing protein [Pirellulaceae bacterium]
MDICRLLVWSLVAQLPATGQTAPAVPAIGLYNPTPWEVAVPVEIPTGRLAAPGLVDWTQVHLECAGVTVPHALRSGRATWQRATADRRPAPRAEDLLVFSCAVPARQWVHVQVVPGAVAGVPALRHESGKLVVTAGDTRVVIDQETASLESWEAWGTPLLERPLRVTAVRLLDPGYALEGYLSVGYTTAAINVRKGDVAEMTVRLADVNAAPALTEVSFDLDVAQGPSATLIYRVSASGQLEITCDERPWEGHSPWLRHALQYSLDVVGQSHDALAELENRWAFYGFRDYTAAVKSVARVHRQAHVGVLETGEEFVNGRHFARRLTPIASPDPAHAEHLAELLDEGLVTSIQPLTTGPLGGGVYLVDATSSPAIVTELAEALVEAGVECASSAAPGHLPVRLGLVPPEERDGIAGDGYVIGLQDGGVSVRAGTRLGLYSAVRTMARHLQRHGRDGGVPLVARNPVVDLRGGGFGGGNFEVDFPYGTETEWCRVLDNLLDSGMNVFACMGMWANWKMPVSYQHMPELRSDAPDAYDESSGAKFVELDHHREHGLRL